MTIYQACSTCGEFEDDATLSDYQVVDGAGNVSAETLCPSCAAELDSQERIFVSEVTR